MFITNDISLVFMIFHGYYSIVLNYCQICIIIHHMEINIRNKIKSILSLNGMTLTHLAKVMSERTGKNYTLASLYSKLKIESLSLREAYLIADILGYEIDFKKIN